MSDSSSDYGKQYEDESSSNEEGSLTKAMLTVSFPHAPSFGHGGPVKAFSSKRGMMPSAMGPQAKRAGHSGHFNNVNSQIGSIIYQSL